MTLQPGLPPPQAIPPRAGPYDDASPHPLATPALPLNDSLLRAAHELKGPAAAMLGLAELMSTDADAPPSPRQASHLQHLRSAGQHLLAMVDELLDLSRLQADRLPLKLQPLDLGPLAREALAGCTAAAQARGLDVRLTEDAPATRGLGDRQRTMQVLMNLLSNALRYNRPGGCIEVAVGPGPQVVVSDQGEGLDAAQVARLFQPFDRLGRERLDHDGLGIGLALSRELAQRMGGTLTVRSAVGVGTAVTLALPPVPACAVPTAAPRGDGCLLSIDANPVHALRLQEHLRLSDGPAVRTAATGRDGLALAAAQRPLAVLLELSLPDLPGLQVLHQLRSDPATRDVPVAVLTSTVNRELLQQARRLGAQACWAKPLDLRLVDTLLADLLQPATA